MGCGGVVAEFEEERIRGDRAGEGERGVDEALGNLCGIEEGEGGGERVDEVKIVAGEGAGGEDGVAVGLGWAGGCWRGDVRTCADRGGRGGAGEGGERRETNDVCKRNPFAAGAGCVFVKMSGVRVGWVGVGWIRMGWVRMQGDYIAVGWGDGAEAEGAVGGRSEGLEGIESGENGVGVLEDEGAGGDRENGVEGGGWVRVFG